MHFDRFPRKIVTKNSQIWHSNFHSKVYLHSAFQPISQQKYFALLGRAFWKQHKFSGFKSYFRFLIVLVVVSKDDLFVFLYGLGALLESFD
jgi:hypothetical protein